MSGSQDREISLGTMTILAIFFGLAVLCAVFFGFGYSLGRKSVVAGPPVVATPSVPNIGAVGGPKPSGGNAMSTSQPPTPAPPSTIPVRNPGRSTPADGAVVGDPESPIVPVAARVANDMSPAGGGSAIVQVAAVSHQEDADLLTTTLKRRGYAVVIHSEPQDKLLHVQVGPFATHKEADLMRQKLLADGFNAIVKDAK